MIKLENVHKSFGKNEVLKGINLHIKQGQVVVIIGPSGSGKSTVLRTMNYLEEPTSGKVIVDGMDLSDKKKLNEVRAEVGMVFQNFNLFPHMTVMDNLTLAQTKVRKTSTDEAKKIDSGTSQLTNPTGGGLSLGETILASAAGAILGSWIGSKLFNNQNFQNQQRTTYKTPQAYERSQNSFNRSSAGTNAGRSGFYSPNNTSTQNRSTSGATSNYGG
ncbi:ATP-binding cassette domain-containing protein [Helicobacter winghamensis]|uniref:ATP-binding cassette domain-containing protein n=1 Tax=Helicobacter winghamensis TaxID=157268 RepID=UPI00242A6DDC|nr:ATP-binding cassette domain-containing protein [Helicobacter winghamensis]